MWRGLCVAARSLLQSDPQIMLSPYRHAVRGLTCHGKPVLLQVVDRTAIMGSSSPAPRGGAMSQSVQAPQDPTALSAGFSYAFWY
jgi:hypothetical protein